MSGSNILLFQPFYAQVKRAVLDLCLDPSDSYLAAVAVDVSSADNSVASSVRLYEVGRQRPAAGDDDDDTDGAADEVRCLMKFGFLIHLHLHVKSLCVEFLTQVSPAVCGCMKSAGGRGL